MRIANPHRRRHHLFRYPDFRRFDTGTGSVRTMMTAALAFPSPSIRISTMPSQIPNPVSENFDDAWQLVTSRDPRADGRIFYAVRTTGVFCRPSCPIRRPCLKNVEFFSDLVSAFG